MTLQWSIQAIAQEASVQRGLFPWFVCVADELALDFEEHYLAIQLEDVATAFGPECATLLREFDSFLENMSGPENLPLWEGEALDSAPEWTELRNFAARVLGAFGWSNSPPPLDRAVFVGPDA